MMKFLFAALMLMSTMLMSSFAGATGWMTSLGANVNYQLGSNGRTYEAAVPLSLRAGYRFSFADIYGEYTYVGSSSGTSLVNVSQTNQEFVLWARRKFYVLPHLALYAAAGGGAHVQSVATAVGSLTDRAVGSPELLGALAGGAEWRFARAFAVGLEARASFAESYAPNPLFGLGAFFSFLF